jgi:AcrR family transcriptional regulator
MLFSDREIRDPRTRRTRRLLQSALWRLLQTKSFDELSVQDITDAATVNRATFYDHYTDKYALLEAMVAGGFHTLLVDRNLTFNEQCQEAVGAIVLATCDYLSQAHGGPPSERHRAFVPLIDAAMTEAIQEVVTQGMEAFEFRSEASNRMISAAVSWAIYGTVKHWFSTPDRLSPEEVVGTVLSLVMPIFKSAEPRYRNA